MKAERPSLFECSRLDHSPVPLSGGGEMARTNVSAPATPGPVTHEGAPAKRITAEQELRRTALACLLWEDSFYESGVSIAERLVDLCLKVTPESLEIGRASCRERV